MKKNKLYSLVIMQLLILSGCSSSGQPNTETVKPELAPTKDSMASTVDAFKNVTEQVKTWQSKIDNSKELEQYGPDIWEQLNQKWKKVREIYDHFAANPSNINNDASVFSSKTNFEAITEQLAVVETLYNKLLDNKERAQRLVADATAQMDFLKTLNVPEKHQAKLIRIEDEYKKLLKDLPELSDEKISKRNSDFIKHAKEFESLLIIEQKIVPLQATLESMRKADIEDIAPISYASAVAKLEEAIAKIKIDPRDQESINKDVSSVEFEIQHIEQISNEVGRFNNVDNDKYEALVLEYEDYLHKIATAMGSDDLRNLPLKEQAAKLAQYAQVNAGTKAAVTQEPLAQEVPPTPALQNQMEASQRAIDDAETSVNNLTEEQPEIDFEQMQQNLPDTP